MNSKNRNTLISVREMTFSREKGKPAILQRVNADIFKGDLICIIGPNGSGKTTFIKLLLGILQPSEGNIERRSGIRTAYLPQENEMNKLVNLTVTEVISLSLFFRLKIRKKRDKQRIDDALEVLDIIPLRDKFFFALSGGEKQKVLLASALASKPDLLFLDEPNTGFDSGARDAFYKKLEQIHRKYGITIVMVTHDLSIIPVIAGRVFCIHKGLDVHEEPQEALTCPIMEKHLGTSLEILLHGSSTPHRVLKKHEEDK